LQLIGDLEGVPSASLRKEVQGSAWNLARSMHELASCSFSRVAPWTNPHGREGVPFYH